MEETGCAQAYVAWYAMPNDAALDRIDDEWQPCRVTFPRFGLLLNRDGVRNRLIWPGRYFVRKSRTFSRPIYRRRSS
jgi:hypothetical protein